MHSGLGAQRGCCIAMVPRRKRVKAVLRTRRTEAKIKPRYIYGTQSKDELWCRSWRAVFLRSKWSSESVSHPMAWLFFLALPVLSSRVIFSLYSISLVISGWFPHHELTTQELCGVLCTGQGQTFHLGLLCIALCMLGLANSLRLNELNGVKSLQWWLHALLSRCGFRAIFFDSCLFKIPNFCQLELPTPSHPYMILWCALFVEFGVAAFFFEMFPQSQHLAGLQSESLQRFYH